jgi:hypothetical protein
MKKTFHHRRLGGPLRASIACPIDVPVITLLSSMPTIIDPSSIGPAADHRQQHDQFLHVDAGDAQQDSLPIAAGRCEKADPAGEKSSICTGERLALAVLFHEQICASTRS